MNIYSILSSNSVPKLRYGPLTLNIETCVTIFIICVYVLNRYNVKLYLPSMFQDIEIRSRAPEPKIET